MVNVMLYIKSWFLTKTPGYLIMLLFAIPSYLVIRNGLRIQARYVELAFYLTMWMPFFLLFPLERGNHLHLLPLFKEGWDPILKGVSKTILAFTGPEIIYIIYPFLRHKQYALPGFLIANTLTMLFYLYVTFVSFVFYTPDEIVTINQPLLSLLKNIEFRFLERFDMIFLALYLFVVSKTWIPQIYCSVFSTCHMLKKQDHKSLAALYLILAIACVFVIQPTWNQCTDWQTLISKCGMGLLFVLPVLLYIYVRGFEIFRRWKTE
jgi:spore germination protein (amino acid permease)